MRSQLRQSLWYGLKVTATGIAILGVISCSRTEKFQEPRIPSNLERIVIAEQPSSNYRHWDGVVKAVQQASLSTQTTGRVQRIHVDVGDSVAKNDTLIEISSDEQQAGFDSAYAQVKSAKSEVIEAEQNYRRYVSLSLKQSVSAAQLDQAKAHRDLTLGRHRSAVASLQQARQQLKYTKILAPFSGVISERFVDVGETVNLGHALLVLHEPETLRVEVRIPLTEVNKIKDDHEAIILLDHRRIALKKFTLFPSADIETHSVVVRLDLPSMTSAPAPGTTVKVLFTAKAEEAYRSIYVPTGALVQRGEVSAVYVVSDNRILLRQVQIGRSEQNLTEIISGLKKGEVIAADPVAALQAMVTQRKVSKNS